MPSANAQQTGWWINIFQIPECEMDLLYAPGKAKERRTDVAHIHSRWAHPKRSHTGTQLLIANNDIPGNILIKNLTGHATLYWRPPICVVSDIDIVVVANAVADRYAAFAARLICIVDHAHRRSLADSFYTVVIVHGCGCRGAQHRRSISEYRKNQIADCWQILCVVRHSLRHWFCLFADLLKFP